MGIPKFWARPAVSAATASSTDSDRFSDLEVVHDGELTYTGVKAHNGSGVTYQEAVGAPVESESPLGYHVGWATVLFLNINQMIGTGIFSTRTCILIQLANLTTNVLCGIRANSFTQRALSLGKQVQLVSLSFIG